MSQLVNTPGISSVLMGGVVCYKSESKQSILNVPLELIQKHTCESTRISTAIAESIMKLADSQVAVGITGLASKGASQSIHKPKGSIFLTVINDGVIYQTTTLLKGNREQIRNRAAIFCFDQILAILKSDNFEKSKAVLKKSITSRGRRIIDYRVD